MTTIELHLDEETLERAKRIATDGKTMEDIFAAGVERLDLLNAPPDPLWGLFSDIPEVMDQIVEEAMQARERDRFRWTDDEIAS